MYTRITQPGYGFKSFLADLRAKLAATASQMIESQLASRKSPPRLYRQAYQRRSQVSRQSQATCQVCGSQQASDFVRNGRRRRQLVTDYGVLQVWLPRVRWSM